MGFASLLFECLIELLNILHSSKHEIQPDDIHILARHKEKKYSFLYNYRLYVYFRSSKLKKLLY